MSLQIDQLSTCFTCGRVSNEQHIGDQYCDQFNNIFSDRLSKAIGTPQFVKDPAVTRFCRYCSEILVQFGKFRERCIKKLEEHDAKIDSDFASCKKQPANDDDIVNDETEAGWWDSYHEKQAKEFRDAVVDDTDTLLTQAIDYTCPECGMMFESQTLYKQHYFELHDPLYRSKNQEAWCSLCKITIFDVGTGAFCLHVREKHCLELAGGVTKCLVCSKECKDFRTFYRHFIGHREYKQPRKCPICPDRYFTFIKKFSAHLAQSHYKGAVCKEDRQFICKKCDFVTANPRYYETHIRIGHFGEKYCRYCRKPIPSAEWDEHYKFEASKHGYELDHQPVATMKYYQPELLKIRWGDAVVECGLCYRLVFAKTINYHFTTHSTGSLIVCDLCGKKFQTEINLRTHFANMHRDTLTCDLCNFTSTSKITMRGHMRIHIRENNPDFDQVTCQICGNTYNERYIRYHIELVHSGNDQSKGRRLKSAKGSELEEICTKCGALVKSDLLPQHKCGLNKAKSNKTLTRGRSKPNSSHIERNLEPIEPVEDVPLWGTPGAVEPNFEVVYELKKKMKNFLKTPEASKVNRKHECDECQFTTTNMDTFRTHLYNNHGTWICAICSTGCFNEIDMKKHLMVKHQKSLSPELCRGPCEDRAYPPKLLKIGLTRSNDSRYIKWVPSKIPVFKEDGTIYKRTVPDTTYINGNIKCNYCENGFINLFTFKYHMETQHLDVLLFQCTKCIDLAYVNENHYIMHSRRVHGVELPMTEEPVGIVDSIMRHGKLYGRLKVTPEGVIENSRSKPKKRTFDEMEEDNY